MGKIAIVGAGMAGAACANALVRAGRNVVVFDKSRGVGGRMSSKRAEQGYLDLGAQYFTARNTAFQQQCQHWLKQDAIAPWQGKLARYQDNVLTASDDDTVRFIGVPSMHKPVQQLLHDIDVRTECGIDAVMFDGKNWQLYSKQIHLGSYTQLILALPQQQALALLSEVIPQQPKLAECFNTTALLPCWAVDIELNTPTLLAFDGIFVKSAAVSWAARQSSKPGRAQKEHWLVHFAPEYSQLHLEADSAQMAEMAVAELQRIIKQPLAVKTTLCHRWRFAQQCPAYPVQRFIYQPEQALGLCGDWLNGGRVENAWLSGNALAQEISA